ncbi:MAG: translation initiation factor IF-2 N-terminal domain-containing protein, partial [Kiritimatiellae bacterium]|nr:translation initiation factor IF-2 N-terminal domain-containing protein [Kiritimatiellia bacterium]
MRVHELAKEINMGSKEFVEKLRALNIETKSH